MDDNTTSTTNSMMMEDPHSVGPDTRTVYIAFALVFGAGMATAIGASVVIFLPRLIASSSSSPTNMILNRYVLASSLGMSAGVMIYVSLIEIFQKSRTAFVAAGYAENIAYVYATACFFAGVIIMMVRFFSLRRCLCLCVHMHATTGISISVRACVRCVCRHHWYLFDDIFDLDSYCVLLLTPIFLTSDCFSKKNK